MKLEKEIATQSYFKVLIGRAQNQLQFCSGHNKEPLKLGSWCNKRANVTREVGIKANRKVFFFNIQ